MSNHPPPAQDVLAVHPNDLKSPTPSPQISPIPVNKAKWKAGGSSYLDGLEALPEVRPIPWVPGKELPPEKSTQSPRVQTRGAFLLSTRGKINDPPCTHCATGVGRFLYCISHESWFHNACNCCQMATRGNLCSLRVQTSDKKNGENASPSSRLPVTSASEPPLAKKLQQEKAPRSPKNKRKRESLSGGEQLQSYPPSNDAPSTFRSGTTLLNNGHSHYMPQSQAMNSIRGEGPQQDYRSQDQIGHLAPKENRPSVNQTYTTPFVAPNSSTPPNYTQSPSYNQYQGYSTHSPTPEVSYYNYNDPSANVINQIYKAPPHINNSNVTSEKPYQTIPQSQSPQIALNSRISSHLRFMVPQTPTNRSGVQQKSATTVSIPLSKAALVPEIDREDSRSISPSEQLLGQGQPVSDKSSEILLPASSLDKLSGTRQKQVEDLVRSLRQGIRNAKQQAESMERQLEQLEDVLGFSTSHK